MKKSVRTFVIALVLLMAVFAVIKVMLFCWEQVFLHQAQDDYWREQAAQVQKYHEIWRGQKITKYRIGIRLLGYPEDCSNEFVVNNNAITQIIKSDCEYNSNFGTVEDLFSMIERMIDGRLCGANGCKCDGPFVTDAVYDTQYGFPKSGRPTVHRELSWIYGFKGVCTLLGDLGMAWDIDSFSPVP